MSNIREVAGRLNLSVATVSRVLNHRETEAKETRDRVLACCRELKYAPDRQKSEAIRTGKFHGQQKKICMVLCDCYPDDPVCAPLLTNLINASICNNSQFAIVHLKNDIAGVEDLPALLRKRQWDGLLLHGNLTASLTKVFAEFGLPAVIIGDYSEEVLGPFCNVTHNVEAPLQEVVQKLANRGVRNIAYVVECPDNYSNTQYQQHFLRLAAEKGIRVAPENYYAGKGQMSGMLEILKPVFRRRELPFDGVFALDERNAREVDKLNFMRSELFGVPPIPVATIRHPHNSGYEKILISPGGSARSRKRAEQSMALLLEVIQAARNGKPVSRKTVYIYLNP